MNPINRRQMLSGAAGAAAGLLLPRGRTTMLQAASALQPPRPCAPDAWRKHGIVLEATEPWEGTDIQNFTSPAEALEGDRWRIWYSARAPKKGFNLAYAEGPLGGSMKKVPAVCTPGEPEDGPYAIGHLPTDWKPTQGIHIRLRDGRIEATG